MHVALHGSQENLSGTFCLIARSFLCLENRLKDGHRLLHGAGCLHHLWQEHLSGTKQVAHPIHTVHQRLIDDIHGTGIRLQCFGNILLHVIADPFHQRVAQPLLQGESTPLFRLRLSPLGALLPFYLLGVGHQPFGRIFVPVKHRVFNQFKGIGRNLLVDDRLRGIHDPHIESRLDGVVEERRVHHIPYRLVATEGERQVADTPAHLGVRQVLLDPPGGTYKVHRVIRVLLDPRGDGQHVRVEDNIFRVEPVLREQVVRPFADLDPSLVGIRLSRLVERHHHHGRAVIFRAHRLLQELLFPVLERDGIRDRLTLNALQSRFQHLPFRRVDHDGHARHVGVRRQHIQEIGHLLRPFQEAIIHVNIKHLRAIFYLFPRDIQCLVVFLLLNQPEETAGTGHVAPLTDIQEVDLRGHLQQLQPRETHVLGRVRLAVRRGPFHHTSIFFNVFRRGSAAPPHDVYQFLVDKLFHLRRHLLRRFVVFSQLVGQSRVGVHADIERCQLAQLFNIRFQVCRSQRTVQPDR